MSQMRMLFLASPLSVLPSFKDLVLLRRVHLETMKGLRELMPVADAPVLEDLVLCDMGHLHPDELRPFLGHPSLRRATIGLGSKRKNEAAVALLGLPPAGYKFDEGFVFRE